MLPESYFRLSFYSFHLELSQVAESHAATESTEPESLTFTAGLAGSLEKMLMMALSVPVDVGANVAVTVQELPVDIVVQSFIWPKSAAASPVMLISFITRSDTPMFEMVTILGEEVLPTCTEPNATLAGETEILGGAAVPEAFTVTSGFLGSLEEMVTTALFLPKGRAGEKLAAIVHDPPASMVAHSFS
jgi:hypothetical protein